MYVFYSEQCVVRRQLQKNSPAVKLRKIHPDLAIPVAAAVLRNRMVAGRVAHRLCLAPAVLIVELILTTASEICSVIDVVMTRRGSVMNVLYYLLKCMKPCCRMPVESYDGSVLHAANR